MRTREIAGAAEDTQAHWVRWALLVGGAVALVVLFYAEENWRGKNSWQQYQKILQARGQTLDWESFIPKPVPDEDNIFSAPNMSVWFVGRGGNDLSGRLSSGRDSFVRQRETNGWLELTFVPLDAPAVSEQVDLVLRYSHSVLTPGSSRAGGAAPAAARGATAGEELTELLRQALTTLAGELQGPRANAVQSFTTFVRSAPELKPRQVVVRADQVPNAAVVESFFRKGFAASARVSSRVQAVAAGTNRFRILLSPAPYTAAADYLAWSDQFEPDFALVRNALQRPFALMNGNYEQPAKMPIPNFIALRALAQTLAQRAQCQLLLGRTEDALRDVSLLHDLCRLLQGPPGGRPMTLVAAMIHVAITGLYVGVIEEGLRLDAWREPQLAQIQQQLETIRLLSFIAAAFQTERASICRFLETATPAEFDQLVGGAGPNSLWDRLRDPRYTLLALAPRGWIYQNMRAAAQYEQEALDCFDPSRGLILQTAPQQRVTRISSSPASISHYAFLPELMPNLLRCIQTTARTQTLVNEAQVACALERYRFAHGQYPENLSALVPQTLKQLPADLLSGGPLKFRVLADGGLVLYSVGWNRTDEGGRPGTNDPTGFDLEQGDWVWPYRHAILK